MSQKTFLSAFFLSASLLLAQQAKAPPQPMTFFVTSVGMGDGANLGGLAVGVFSHGMEAGQAMQVFSILTIGDGLVAQIPALFSAMAAGLLVTRTTDESRDGSLGPAIVHQIGSKPKVLVPAAILCLLMALIPGFPAAVFIGIAIALGASAAWQHPVSKRL